MRVIFLILLSIIFEVEPKIKIHLDGIQKIASYSGEYRRKADTKMMELFLKLNVGLKSKNTAEANNVGNTEHWSDIFEKYQWNEVISVVKVQKIELKNTVVNTEFINRHFTTNCFDTEIKSPQTFFRHTKTDFPILITTFPYIDKTKIPSNFIYDIVITFKDSNSTNSTDITKFSYNLGWGSYEYITEVQSVIVSDELPTIIKPQQTLDQVNVAETLALEYDVIYEINLHGNVTEKLDNKDHGDFRSVPIDDFLISKNLKNGKTVRQYLRSRFYTGGKVIQFLVDAIECPGVKEVP